MKKFLQEFKEFAIKGNALDLAIGVIIGAAFKAIVDSLVANIIMPVVGIIIGGKDFTSLCVTIGDAKIEYGMLIQNIVDFLIVAAALFVLVKIVNSLKRPKEEPPVEVKKPDDIALLEEIRDLLKNKGM